MAQIVLGAKTVLNLATDLDPMFTELYSAAGGNYTTATTFTFGNGTGQRLMVINAGNSAANDGGAISFRRAGTDFFIIGDHGRVLGTSPGDGIFYSGGANNQRFYTNGVERMRIDSSGNVGIGKASAGEILESARAISVHGTLQSATGPKLAIDHNAATGVSRLMCFGHTTGTHGTFEVYQASSNNSVNRTALSVSSAGNFQPGADNTQTLGSGSLRWSTVYAGTGAINTSDAREKTTVSALSAAEIAAAQALGRELGKFKFLQAVQDKGDAARTHIGMTVQRAIEIMEDHGLVAFDYAFICYDEWEVEPGSTAQSNRYSFRSDELALFIAAGQQAAHDALMARLEALEEV